MRPILFTTLTTLLLIAAPLLGPARAQTPASPDGYQRVTLPATAGAGKPVEARVVADTPHVKSVVIILRKGATLTEHATPHAAAIQALSGRGQVRLGKKLEKLSPTEMVLLDPGVKHEVIADKDTDLILLVHHLKGAAQGKGPAPAAAPHDHH